MNCLYKVPTKILTYNLLKLKVISDTYDLKNYIKLNYFL